VDKAIQKRLEEWRDAVRQHLTQPNFPAEPSYLFEPMRYALNAEGKMLRSALCLAAAEALGGNWRDAVKVGVALEIFHTFSLIHDDIMDGDELRRGIPTVHKAYDTDRALLAGDTLLIYVYQLISESDADKFPALFKSFNDGAMEVCLGQGWDMQFEQSADIEAHEYEMMIDLKTGALLKLACKLGGIIAGGSQADIDTLSRFGQLLGRAFQMQDDLLEVTSSVAEMGKSLGSDVLNEKKTWIWQDLKKNFTIDELSQWQQIKANDHISGQDRDQVYSWMKQYGTISRAEDLIQKWITEADSILTASSFHNTTMLKALADIILKRQN